MTRQSISSDVEASREMLTPSKRIEMGFVLYDSCDSRESHNASEPYTGTGANELTG